jgi:hypothetical protein
MAEEEEEEEDNTKKERIHSASADAQELAKTVAAKIEEYRKQAFPDSDNLYKIHS